VKIDGFTMGFCLGMWVAACIACMAHIQLMCASVGVVATWWDMLRVWFTVL